MSTDSLGCLFEARIESDNFPMFALIHSCTRRSEARSYALRNSREAAVLFIRHDGFHESWDRGELERGHVYRDNPKIPGTYLLLAYEWVGLGSDKPAKPSWAIRKWDGKHWERERYTFDTGNYENFEFVRWADLPPVSD